MNHNYEFAFGRIILKPLGREDIEQQRILRNNLRSAFATQDIITAEMQENWYASYLNKDNDIMFKIVKADAPDEFIGAIAVYDIDNEKSTAEVGRTVVDKEKAPEKGIGMEATKAVCLFAFEILGIKKIIGTILKNNERIIKVDKRAGFVIDGEIDEDTYSIHMTRDTLTVPKALQLGQSASIIQTATDEILKYIAAYSGDVNPVHFDDDYATGTIFKQRIAHGLFCMGMVSNVIGNILPGRGTVFINENVNYRSPVFLGDAIQTTVTVAEVLPKNKYLLSLECKNQNGQVVLDGTSLVKVM